MLGSLLLSLLFRLAPLKDFSVTNFDYFGDIFQAWCLVPAESKVRHAKFKMSCVSPKDQLERSKLYLVSANQFSVDELFAGSKYALT